MLETAANRIPTGAEKIIDLRRELQDSLVQIRNSLLAVEQADGRTAASQRMTSDLSAMRTAIALHQAEWPAVAIDTSDPAYRIAVRQLRRATDGFLETAKAVIAGARP